MSGSPSYSFHDQGAGARHPTPIDGTSQDSRRTATRADLLEAVAAACPHLSRTQTRDILEMTLDEVAEALRRGENVKFRSFGLFSVREKRERIGRNPRTGETVPITPRRVLTFKPSPVLLDQLNGETEPGCDEL